MLYNLAIHTKTLYLRNGHERTRPDTINVGAFTTLEAARAAAQSYSKKPLEWSTFAGIKGVERATMPKPPGFYQEVEFCIGEYNMVVNPATLPVLGLMPPEDGQYRGQVIHPANKK